LNGPIASEVRSGTLSHPSWMMVAWICRRGVN
jgi:hypothetical protein